MIYTLLQITTENFDDEDLVARNMEEIINASKDGLAITNWEQSGDSYDGELRTLFHLTSQNGSSMVQNGKKIRSLIRKYKNMYGHQTQCLEFSCRGQYKTESAVNARFLSILGTEE